MTATVQKHPPVGKARMIPDDKRRRLFGVQGHQLTKTADPIEEPLDGSSCKPDRIRSRMESVASLLIQCWVESAPNDLSSGLLICMPFKKRSQAIGRNGPVGSVAEYL